MTDLPGTRRLLTTWALLMGLTLLSMVSARLDQGSWQALPLWSAGLVVAATGFKAQRVLTLALIAGSYLAARLTAG